MIAIATARGVDANRQLRLLGAQLRSDIWGRWVATAQRRALIWWRNRRVSPGLAARFTSAGASFYHFPTRLRKPSSLRPYYHVNGDLERMLLKRKPRTSRKTGNVVTKMAYGGGALNFMDNNSRANMHAITGWQRSSRTLTESYSVGSYVRSGQSGSMIRVTGYSMTRSRTVTKTLPVRGGETHAAIFGRFGQDRPAIEARVAVELRRIVRSAAYDKRTGKLKSSVLRDAESEAA